MQKLSGRALRVFLILIRKLPNYQRVFCAGCEDVMLMAAKCLKVSTKSEKVCDKGNCMQWPDQGNDGQPRGSFKGARPP